MDIVQEETSTHDDGKESAHTAVEHATSAVSPGPNQSSDQDTGEYHFPAISSKARIESGNSLSILGGTRNSLQRQSFGSSGSLLAHFNNFNKQDSNLNLNNAYPTDFGGMQRAPSRESALGLPIGQDDDETTGRPPSRALMYTPPARDLITPPAQTFSVGASGIRGIPPPIASREGINATVDKENNTDMPSTRSTLGHNDERRLERQRFLCVAPADKDSVKLAIARMAMEAAQEKSSNSS